MSAVMEFSGNSETWCSWIRAS